MQWLRCPACLEELNCIPFERDTDSNSVKSGLLSCSCTMKYPVWQGVPRMLLPGSRIIPPEYLDRFENRLGTVAYDFVQENAKQQGRRKYTFDVQWSMYEYSQLTWEHDLPTRVRLVYKYLRVLPGELNDSLILDAGCGNGTLSAGLAVSGPEIIAMDFSDSVGRAEQMKTRFAGTSSDRVHFIQGDVQRPPFSPNTFDVVYSDGVLHHTPDTRRSFLALAPLVKPGGRYFVWLYRADAKFPYNLKLSSIKSLQAALRPLPLGIMRVLCFAGAAGLLARRHVQHLFGNRRRPLIPLRLKAVNLFDTLTPRYCHLQTPAEVRDWFKLGGFPAPFESSIEGLSDAGFGMTAIREAQNQPAMAQAAMASS
jgi:2-polyprenyl-3-methyl-5-hydroxy-6-metoxy-1,4-benzoquinol methylase/uncharacterized protein YbaR (Trm112 family)